MCIITVDGKCAVQVDDEKFLLVREVIKHYTARWQGEYQQAQEKDKPFDIGHTVSTMLKKLSVEHTVIPISASMSVINDIPAASAPQEPQAEETEAPAPEPAAPEE